MTSTRVLGFVFITCFVFGFWTACTIGFDPGGDNGEEFSCSTNDDCIAPKQCFNGICGLGGESCVDDDDDGYGVGDTTLCASCQEEDKCAEDCNDGDPSINPGLRETCDGIDNNCDGEIDEPQPCQGPLDCGDESPFRSECNASICEYFPPISTGECNQPAACVGGMRTAPDACF